MCPSATARRTNSRPPGALTRSPRTKNTAGTFSFASASRIRAVCLGSGPSSNVRTTLSKLAPYGRRGICGLLKHGLWLQRKGKVTCRRGYGGEEKLSRSYGLSAIRLCLSSFNMTESTIQLDHFRSPQCAGSPTLKANAGPFDILLMVKHLAQLGTGRMLGQPSN